MDNNRWYPEGEAPRHDSENQRIGRDINRDRGNRPFSDQYRSGQSYHNRNEGYGPDQTHYGSRPDSAYRDPNINFGDNRQHRSGDRNQNDGMQGRFSTNLSQPPRDYPDSTRPEQHHEHRYYTERDDYKDSDYRFRSGNRGNWHAPGDFLQDNDNDRRDRQDYRRDNRHQDEGFFDRMGNSISNTWNRITHSDDDDNYNQRNRNVRGYDPGPRWADESDNNRYERELRNRRRYNQDDY